MVSKLSRYNVYVDVPSGPLVVFNSLTGALLSLGLGRARLEALVDRAGILDTAGPTAGPITGPTAEERTLLDTLRRHGALIESGHDELAYFLRARRERLDDPATLRLTVLLTLFCNLACTYCYESQAGPAMTDETESRLTRFVARSVEGGLKILDINWFGGEPLLEWDRLVRLTRGFRETCAASGCLYLAGIATNGYLLDRAKVGALRELGVRSVVVTLDGPPRVHDGRRVLRGGGPTFTRILAGVEALAESGQEVGLQVNCDSSTTGEDLGELLAALGSVRPAVTLHFRWVFPSPARWRACAREQRDNLTSAPPHDRVLALSRAAVAAGFKVRNPLIHPRVAFCNTEYRNHWVIHPAGELHKCNVEFELGHPCGSLGEDGRPEVDAASLERWLAKDPAADDRCRECVWLPVCTGGCAFAREGRDDPPCPHGGADRFSDYVLLEYLQRKGGSRS